MPTGVLYPPILSSEEANSFGYGLQQGANIHKILAEAEVQRQNAEKLRQLMPFLAPTAQAELTGLQQKNQWNPRIWQSEIGLRGAQAGLYGAQTKETGMRTAGLGTENEINRMKLQMMRDLLRGGGGTGGAGGAAASGMGGVSGATGETTGAGTANTGSSAPSAYGIETPMPTRQDMANKMFFGMDTFSSRSDNAKAQQEDQYKKFQEASASAASQADAANSMNQAIGIFNDAMNRSLYTGAALGSFPSSGFGSAFVPGNLSPEQEADRASMNMLPSAISTLRDAMGQARFSNLDMSMAGKMKFDRTMEKGTRELMTNWVGNVNKRINESGKFYQVMNNPSKGANKATADMLWTSYQQNFPLISPDGKNVNTGNLNKWWLYTTPRAIESIKRTGNYVPSKQELETTPMQIPDGKGGTIVVPIKSGKVEEAMKHGAIPL